MLDLSTTAPVAVTAIFAVGGWIWFFGRQTAQLTALAYRINTLERQQATRDEKISAIGDRLARMEPMLELLVSGFRSERLDKVIVP